MLKYRNKVPGHNNGRIMKKGPGVKMKPSGIGGMAVMEGVMMKNKDEYAVAIRKPNNEIVVEKSTYTDFSDKVKLFKLPIFRGMLAFVDSVVMGVKLLNFSAGFLEEEEETAAKEKKAKGESEKKVQEYDDDFEIDEVADKLTKDKEARKAARAAKEENPGKKGNKGNAILVAMAVLFSIVLSAALFIVLPVLIKDLLSRFIQGKYTLDFLEGVLRLAIFIIYVILAAKMPEFKRTFMYHGAEHKAINCLENGFELTVENVKWQSKQHKCCGTGFMLLVIIISLFFFFLMPVENVVLRIVSRVVVVPLVAGISYEFIRFAGKSESRLIHILSQPGLWMQRLTTKEPDDEMIEVAIQSVGAVFDWKTFLADPASDGKDKIVNNKIANNKTANNKTANGKAANNKTADNKTADGKAANNKTADNKTADDKVANSKTIANNKNGENKAADTINKDTSSRSSSVKEKKAKDLKERGRADIAAEKEVSASMESGYTDRSRRNHGMAPVAFKPVIKDETEEEDDEILRALDKFFDGQSGGKQDND